MALSTDDRHWLAGLLEGEGSFVAPAPSQHNQPTVTLQMCDADVVQRAARLMGAAGVYRYHRGAERGWRPVFHCAVGGKKAVALMNDLLPLMGERRRAQIARALDEYRGPLRLTDPPAVCVVPGCRRPHRSRGLCHNHYMLWTRDRAMGRPVRVTPLR